MLANRLSSPWLICTLFPPKPTLRAARLINDTRFEYRLSWIEPTRDCVRVIGTSSPALAISFDILSSWRRRRYLITVAFIANLTRSSGKNQMIFHTQTMPIQAPETLWTLVKPMLA